MNTTRLLTGLAGMASAAIVCTAPAAHALPPLADSGTTALADSGAPTPPEKTTLPYLLPPFNFNANILGFDFKHTNQFPAGVSFDGAVWAVNPEWPALTIGWLVDIAPFFANNCAEGSLVFETKAGVQEVHPLVNQCAGGYIFGVLTDLPAKEYRMVCMSSATVGDRGQRACFRFIN
ncbi:hypothetical protein ACWIGW_42380 [Nocardia brasiliensis]